MILQVGVKVLINDGADNYLFLKRSKAMESEHKPSWDVPGGRMKSEETVFLALAREIYEETGLKLKRGFSLLAAQDIFVPGKAIHVIRLTYETKSKRTAIKLSDEHSDYCWKNRKDVKTMNIEPFLKQVLVGLK
jgi:8-oxo-dGTP diphosphatase